MAYPRSGDFWCNYGEDAIVAPHVPEIPPAPKAPRRGSLAARNTNGQTCQTGTASAGEGAACGCWRVVCALWSGHAGAAAGCRCRVPLQGAAVGAVCAPVCALKAKDGQVWPQSGFGWAKYSRFFALCPIIPRVRAVLVVKRLEYYQGIYIFFFLPGRYFTTDIKAQHFSVYI